MNPPPYKKFPVINLEKIILREILPSDIKDIIEISYYNSKQASNADEALAMHERIKSDYENGNSIHWGISEKNSNVVIGSCGYYRGFANETGELGCVLLTEFRSRGIMTIAMKAALSFGFNTIGLKRVCAITSINNYKAINLLKRLNFEKIFDADNDRLKYEILKIT